MQNYEPDVTQLLGLYQQLEDDIVADMVRRMLKMGFVSESTAYQAEVLQSAGILYEDILQMIADRTDASVAQVRALFEDAGVKTVDIDNDTHEAAGEVPVDIRQDAGMKQVLEAGYRKTLGTMRNLVSTTANTTQTAFLQACDRAYMQVSSGAFSYQDAIRMAVRNLADGGAYVTYPTGHQDRIDVAVRRCVLTGVGQTAAAVAKKRAEDSGCRYMELTAHGGARPEHARWQGQLVQIQGKRTRKIIDGLKVFTLEEIGYGDGRGFKGWNCRHNWHPYYPGLSTPNYTPEEIARLDEKSISYNGEKYTEYEISQMQRKGERKVRALKRRAAALDEAAKNTDDPALKQGLNDDFAAVSVRLKDAEKTLKDFCRQTGRSTAQRAVQAAKRVQNGKKELTSGGDGGIIKEQERMQSSSDYAVPKDLVKSREFRSKFDSMDSDKKLQRQYYQVAKKMLNHRSGTNGEDLYFYNTRTKKWYSSTTGTQAGTPDYTEEIRRALQESEKDEIVSFHNHPLGMPPSAGDLNAALKNGYQKGYTIGHDGTVFEYTAPIFIIDEAVYNKRISLHAEKGDSEFQAQVNALLDLQEFYKFKFKEMKSDG